MIYNVSLVGLDWDFTTIHSFLLCKLHWGRIHVNPLADSFRGPFDLPTGEKQVYVNVVFGKVAYFQYFCDSFDHPFHRFKPVFSMGHFYSESLECSMAKFRVLPCGNQPYISHMTMENPGDNGGFLGKRITDFYGPFSSMPQGISSGYDVHIAMEHAPFIYDKHDDLPDPRW